MEFGTREMPPRKGSDSKPLGRHDANGPQSGEVLQGRYMILGSLGVGGFSSVYRARDLRFPSVTRLCAVIGGSGRNGIATESSRSLWTCRPTGVENLRSISFTGVPVGRGLDPRS